MTSLSKSGLSKSGPRRRPKPYAYMIAWLLPALAIEAPPAFATSIVEQEFARWKIQDKCLADAVTANPNRDVASQRKRDDFVDQCLKNHGMPPRNHAAPSTDEQVQVLQSH